MRKIVVILLVIVLFGPLVYRLAKELAYAVACGFSEHIESECLQQTHAQLREV